MYYIHLLIKKWNSVCQRNIYSDFKIGIQSLIFDKYKTTKMSEIVRLINYFGQISVLESIIAISRDILK